MCLSARQRHSFVRVYYSRACAHVHGRGARVWRAGRGSVVRSERVSMRGRVYIFLPDEPSQGSINGCSLTRASGSIGEEIMSDLDKRFFPNSVPILAWLISSIFVKQRGIWKIRLAYYETVRWSLSTIFMFNQFNLDDTGFLTFLFLIIIFLVHVSF